MCVWGGGNYSILKVCGIVESYTSSCTTIELKRPLTMLQIDRVLLFVFVCVLFQTGTANPFGDFYHADFRCEDWLSYTTEDFVRMASNGFQIGGNMRTCRIFQGRPDQACRWYVKYNIHGYHMNEWTGLDSEGEPWGTGCCSSESNCATALGAGSWLKERHKDICCGPPGVCVPIVFVDRWTWGYPNVIPPTDTTPLNRKLDYYVIHHTATPECSTHSECMERVKSIQDNHMNKREMWDIGYNFLIGGSRSFVYEGRGWHNEGAHAKPYNDRSIGIAIIGDYRTTEPHDGIMDTLKELMKCGVERGIVKEDYALCGHLDLSATVCPGNSLLTLLGGDEFAEGHACVSP